LPCGRVTSAFCTWVAILTNNRRSNAHTASALVVFGAKVLVITGLCVVWQKGVSSQCGLAGNAWIVFWRLAFLEASAVYKAKAWLQTVGAMIGGDAGIIGAIKIIFAGRNKCASAISVFLAFIVYRARVFVVAYLARFTRNKYDLTPAINSGVPLPSIGNCVRECVAI
jgi:hypothetical protein